MDLLGRMIEPNTVPQSVKYPALLSLFLLLVYPDLKSYRFYYWFAAPVILPEYPFTSQNPTELLKNSNPSLLLKIYKAMVNPQYHHLLKERFVACHVANTNLSLDDTNVKIISLEEAWPQRFDTSSIYFLLINNDGTIISGNNNLSEDQLKSFDWSMRNFLTVMSLHSGIPQNRKDMEVNIINLRGTQLKKIFE